MSELSIKEQVIARLNNVFCNKAKNHVGKQLNEVPELVNILNAITVIEENL